jgi:hypothetical protein
LRVLIDQGFVIVYAHVSKLNIENPIGTHGLHPADVEWVEAREGDQTARAAAKWTNMVACVRRAAGAALSAAGSRRRPTDNR